MKNKKFFAKALAFALVMGTVGAHGVATAPVGVVKAAQGGTISFNAANYEVEVASNETGYVLLQVLKENKADAKVLSEGWYKVDGTTKKVTVDLSFLKAGKDQYFRVLSVNGTAFTVGTGTEMIVTVPAQEKTSIKYDAKTQEFIDGKTKEKIDTSALTQYEYKTLYGSYWLKSTTTTSSGTAATTYSVRTLGDLVKENAIVGGTTLVVRTKATATAPAGTEVKVKIAAAAKAPKVKVDYVKGTITFPKNCEVVLYNVTNDVKSGIDINKWASVEGKLDPQELLAKLGKTGDTDKTAAVIAGYTFAVRTKAETGKRPESNITFVSISPSVAIKAGALSSNTLNVSIDATSGNNQITCTMLADEKGMKLTPATITVDNVATTVTGYAYSLDGKKWIPITGEVTVAVASGNEVQICRLAVKGDDTTPPAFASNVVKVKYAYTAPAGG